MTRSQQQHSADTSGKSLEEKILEWIESSGRALEMRVTRDFQHHGAHEAIMSRRYGGQGTETGVAREIDALGVFRLGERQGWVATVNVAVECKASPSTNWIAFDQETTATTPKGLTSANAHFTETLMSSDTWDAPNMPSRVIQRLSDLWTPEAPFNAGMPASTIADGPKPKSGDRDISNNAVMAALSAAEGLAQEYKDQRIYGGYTNAPGDFAIFLSVAVTSTRLFRAKLKDTGGIDLTETDRITVRAPTTGGGMRNVFVIQEHAFPQFVRDITNCVEKANTAIASARI